MIRIRARRRFWSCLIICSMVTRILTCGMWRGKNTWMRMLSACPWGRTPGQSQECVREYKEEDWILFLGRTASLWIVLRCEPKGWGNFRDSKFGKNHRRQTQGSHTGICHLLLFLTYSYLKYEVANGNFCVFELLRLCRGLDRGGGGGRWGTSHKLRLDTCCPGP